MIIGMQVSTRSQTEKDRGKERGKHTEGEMDRERGKRMRDTQRQIERESV